MTERTKLVFEVKWLGDKDYGRDEWDGPDAGDIFYVEARSELEAARKGLRMMAAETPEMVRDEGWYGPTTIVGVRRKPSPPPIRYFVVGDDGKTHRERAEA